MARRKTQTANDLMKEILAKIDKNTEEAKKDISEMRAGLADLNITTVKQQAILEEHMRRTDVAEKNLEKTSERIDPLEKHIQMWSGVGKAVAIAGTVASITLAAYKILGYVGF